MGIVNNTMEGIEVGIGIALGCIQPVLHLGREDTYTLDPNEQPHATAFGISLARSGVIQYQRRWMVQQHHS